jgi:polyphenol oxidase
MQAHISDGVRYYTFSSLEPFGELRHAITARHGGVSRGPYATLNLTKNGDDPEAVEQNLQRACAALEVRREDLVSPNQRHTANVRRVDQSHRGTVLPGFDVVITDRPRVPVLLRYADCVPVMIYDPPHHALAVVHSGWRGTIQGAARAAVEALHSEYGSRPGDMVAAIGPSIGPCCYEIGQEVASAVRGAFESPETLLLQRRTGRPHFDLWAANVRWLAGAGVRQIEVAEVCSACHVAEFFSYRAGGGQTGHFGALMELRSDHA